MKKKLLLCFMLLSIAAFTQAATYTVTTSSDSGTGSLRSAISSALSGDVIQVGPSVNYIYLASGLTIDKSLTITGNGNVTIIGNETFTLLTINSSGSLINVFLNGIRLEGGLSSSFGGGLRITGNVQADIQNCEVSGNKSDLAGAGVYIDSSYVQTAYPTVTFTKSLIDGNSSARGAGVYINVGTLSIDESIISNNYTTATGGGIYNKQGTIKILKSSFLNNQATSGGAVYIEANTAVSDLRQNTFVANISYGTGATSGGGAIFNNLGTISLYNNTIMGNTAVNAGAGVVNAGNIQLGGNIIAGNNAANNPATSDFVSTTSPTDNGYNLLISGTNNLTSASNNSLAFAQLSILFDGNVVSGAFVPTTVIANGVNVVIPKQTGLNNIRIVPSGSSFLNGETSDQRNVHIYTADGVYAAGSVSLMPCPASTNNIWYVSKNYTGDPGEGLEALYPATNLADILNGGCLQDGDIICLASGTYYPEYIIPGGNSADNREKTFYIKQAITLKGGFSDDFSTQDPLTYVTILSGDLGKDDIYSITGVPGIPSISGNNENAYHVLVWDSPEESVISGLTVQGGKADGFSSIALSTALAQNNAAGIALLQGNLEIDNCIIRYNYATSSGGGLYIYAPASVVFNENTVSGNISELRGAGIFSKGIINATYSSFTNNQAMGGNAWGGALSIADNSSPIDISYNLFKENSAIQGGAIYTASSLSTPALVTAQKNTFLGNYAEIMGGAITNTASLSLVYNTFTENAVTETESSGAVGGGAINNWTNATLSLLNNSITGNQAEYGGGVFNLGELTYFGNIIAGNKETGLGTGKGRDLVMTHVTGQAGITDGSLNNTGYNLFTTDGVAEGNYGSSAATYNIVPVDAVNVEYPLDSLPDYLTGTTGSDIFIPSLNDGGGSYNPVVLPNIDHLSGVRLIPGSYLTIPSDQRDITIDTSDGFYCIGSVSISKSQQSITGLNNLTKVVGDSAFTISPVAAGNPKFTFISSDSTVASVDTTGRITILATGTTTITVHALETSTYMPATAQFVLTVGPLVKSIQIITGIADTTVTLGTPDFTIYPVANSGNTVFTFSSSDSTVAVIDSTGKISVLAAGTTTITVNSVETSAFQAASFQFVLTVAPSGKSIQAISAFIDITKTDHDAAFQITPVAAGNPTFEYSSSDPSVATIDPTGLITILKTGTTIITINALETPTYLAATTQFTLTVVPAFQGIKTQPITQYVCLNTEAVLETTAQDADASFSWEFQQGSGTWIQFADPAQQSYFNSLGLTFSGESSSTFRVTASSSAISNSPIRVKVSNAYGQEYSQEVSLILSSPPSPIAFINGQDVLEPNDSYVFEVTLLNTASYAWTYSGSGLNIVASGSMATLSFEDSATPGLLTVTASNACGTSEVSRSLALKNPTAINEVNANDSDVAVYPNPVTTEVHVKSSSSLKSVKIVNIQGQIVTHVLPDSLNENEVFIPVSGLEKGIYLIPVETKDGKITVHKIVKE